MVTSDGADGPEQPNGLDGDDDAPDIGELLDHGYEQLDGFMEWLESERRVDTRTAQQDCLNAETLVDYMANTQRKSADAIDEFDLRWFCFSHYIRKSTSNRETQERLPDSLLRFFDYLSHRCGKHIPDWVTATLDDSHFYLQRLRALQVLASEEEQDWKEGFALWCEELEQDLDLRGLWLPQDLGDGLSWANKMGWREATLRHQANRLWQRERQELLSAGLSLEAARERLAASYAIWLDTPQARLEDATPRQTILGERADQADEQQDDQDGDDDI